MKNPMRILTWPCRSRRFLLAAAMTLVVQTGFPAHQDTHPLNQPDAHCRYCMLAGHLSGMPSVASLLPVAPPEMGPPSRAPIDLPSGALIVWCLAGFAIIMGCMRRLIPGQTLEARA